MLKALCLVASGSSMPNSEGLPAEFSLTDRLTASRCWVNARGRAENSSVESTHVLEGWMRQRKDLRQMLPVLSGYLGHALLKSTELYLRLVPERFVKPLSKLQKSPGHR